MSFDFTIPVTRDDLLRHTGVNQYSVEEVYPIRLLPGKLQEARNDLRSKGPVSIQASFDTFFSIIKHFHSLPVELREDSWEMLVKMPPAFANTLVEYLESDMDPMIRPSHLNTLKMTSYLLCQLMEMFEAEASKPSTTVISAKGRKKAKSDDLGSLEWEIEKERALRGLLQMLQLPVHRLWDPPVVEEEFVNMVTCSCYKLLENPNTSKATNKSTRDTIFQLLGLMVKKYNHGLGCGLKILQLLQHFEHLASPMAQCIELFVNEYGVKTIVSDIMREIGRMDPKDLARDTSGTRAYAAFLVEMAEKIPTTMLPNISVLIGLLDGESYTLRNSVLGVLGELVVRGLSKEGLDSKQKLTRDQFLDKLEDHIHDVHAFTRSKTLQIWHYIAQEKAVPLPRQHSVLELTIGRLKDKSSQVRKYAIQLIIVLLRNNPFAAKLPVEELKTNYEKEKEKLEAMLPEKEPETPQAAAKREVTEHWKAMELDLLARIKSNLEEPPETDEDSEDLIGEEEKIESVKSRITQTLKHKNLDEAISLYQAASQSWPTDPPFLSVAQPKTEEEQMEPLEDTHNTDKINLLLDGLRSIYYGELLPQAIIEGALDSSQTESQPQNTGLVNEITKQQVLVQYLKDSLNFASAIQEAVPVVCQLLGSKNVTDVMEAVDFFVTSFEFGLSNVMVGIRRMLVLVWSKESSIKEAVVEAYRRLYLHPQGGNTREKALAVASNLTALTLGATMGDLTSLEELICEFVKSGDLDKKVIQVLWERFALKIPNTTADESRGALALLGMAAGAEMEIVKSNVEVLVKEGLGPRGETDFLLTREVASALYKLGGTGKAKAGIIPEPFRMEQNHEIFSRLTLILSEGVSKLDQQNWLPMAEQAVNVIYKLAEHPDVICGDIIKRIAQVVMSYHVTPTPQEEEPASQKESFPSEQDEATTNNEKDQVGDQDKESEEQEKKEETEDKISMSPKSSTLQCPSGILTRLLFLAGHIALRQLVHLDVAVFGEMKRRHAMQEEQTSKPPAGNTVTASAMKRNPKIKEEEDDELGMAGAIAEDAEAEFIRKLTEEGIVSGTNLLAMLRPLIVAVCSNQAKFSDPELRAAASLALAKYMMVSSEFCDSHLQLLFTILEKSSHPVIRANTIIALGDLSFRFPNLIEPWTPNLYARLRDPSPTVRKNTLMVLSHLILNDMVKVKGQISELATCIVDDDCRISGLSKLFFNELAKKGNAIYNIMPDMVSRLSDTDIGVSEENFRIIMRYLFGFIQKDRQCESLVEKLCHRFRATINQRQWRDLAFCLSMLSYSEKSLRKLQENFACFGDKVADEDVYSSFMTIISSAKKFAKPEAKVQIEELEERLEACHSKGMEDAEATHKASKATAKAKGKGGKTPTRKSRNTRTRTPRKAVGSDGDGEEGEDFHPAKRTHKAQRPKLSFSSDDEEEDELFKVESGPTEEGVKVPSDNENINPNITGDASPQLITRKCQRSVNNSQKAPVPSPATRKSSRKAAVKYK